MVTRCYRAMMGGKESLLLTTFSSVIVLAAGRIANMYPDVLGSSKSFQVRQEPGVQLVVRTMVLPLIRWVIV